MTPSSDGLKPPANWVLRRTDQAVVALLVATGLASTVAWWIDSAGERGRAIEVDRGEPQTARFQVDINSADWPELVQLPNIGRALADRIVQSRREEGPFADLDELRRVRGIGPKTLAGIRPYLKPMPKRTALAGP